MRIRAWSGRLVGSAAALGCLLTVASTAGVSTAVLSTAATAASASPAAAGYGWLRLAHLSPNAPPVDVYLYSFGKPHAMVVLKHVAYGTVSPYERVVSGDYTVAMRGAGAAPTTKPVLSAGVNVAAGNAYTVAGMGPARALRLQVMRDRLTSPPGQALVRVIQASLSEHRVTVALGHRPVARGLAFARVTAYRAVPPGGWALHAAGGSERAADRIRLTAGSIHTLVVLDGPGHLMLRVLEDAAGSARLPAGAAATGLGGTAPRPGPSLLPWVGIAAGGLLAMAGGLARRRRPRVLRTR